MEDNISVCWALGGVGGGDDYGKIQVHYIKFALYFCYFISSTSDHQALYLGGEGPWL